MALTGAHKNPDHGIPECVKCTHCTRTERLIGRWNYHCDISAQKGANNCHDERMDGNPCGPKGLMFEARV